MAEMKRPQRNYNVVFAFLSALFGIIVFVGFIMGRLDSWLPQGDLGLLRSATEEQILNVQLLDEVTQVNFSESGNYRIISNNPRVRAEHLSLRSATTNEDVSIIVIDRSKYAPYNDELLTGVPLIDFQIDESGSYKIIASIVNIENAKPMITIFPDYKSHNRLRIFGAGALLMVIFFGIFWYRSNQLAIPKEVKTEKRGKWDAFMDESE